jgi:predicted nuclease of predicted toxin-antitoxin system
MKFLVDECTGNGVAEWLSRQGYDVVSILKVSPGISDDEVLSRAFRESRILITMDKDFGDMVFRNKKNHCGIVLLRLESWHLQSKISVIESMLTHYANELEGNFIVLTEQSIRVVQIRNFH